MARVVATTGRCTGRSPKDKYFVAHPELKGEIDWGPANQPLEARAFAGLLRRAQAHVDGASCSLRISTLEPIQPTA